MSRHSTETYSKVASEVSRRDNDFDAGSRPDRDRRWCRSGGHPASAFWGPTTPALCWTDGKRNLAEVIKLTELEMGQSNFD
jgi:hypothetical protein